MVKSISKLAFIILSISLLALTSCERQIENPTEDDGRNYMPMEIGTWVLYDVDSTYWDDYTRSTSLVYGQQIYEVVDTFRDGDGRLSYTINVYKRAAATEPFVPSRVIHATPTNGTLEWNENNVTLINLIFPVANSATWDGTAMISNNDPDLPEYYTDKWNFEYTNVGDPFDGGVKYFDNTVTVNQIDDELNDPDVDSSAYAYKNFSKEMYAANVGMVYKERIYWVFQPKPGGSGYRKGYGVKMTAVDYGND